MNALAALPDLTQPFEFDDCSGTSVVAGKAATGKDLEACRPSVDRAAQQRAAVEAMMVRHGRLVYRVAFAALRHAADAEDVVQETFLQLLRATPDRIIAGAIADERAYLARIAWRLASRRGRRSRELPVESEPAEPADGRSSPEAAAIESDLEAWLHRSIDKLPRKLRQPLVLAALGELRSPQIARVLGIPEGTVRRRIHTARQHLRECLEMKRKGGER